MKWVATVASAAALVVSLWSASLTMQNKSRVDELDIRTQYLMHEQGVLYEAACKHQGFIDRILKIQGEMIQMMKQQGMVQPQPGDLLL